MNQENSIEIVSVTFGAGDSRLFALTGEYFEIIEAPTPVDVVLSDFNGSQRARMSQASASFYSKGVKFGVIQITSAGAQTIRFAYGTGETGTRRSSGSVTVSGPVTIGNAIALDAATLAALEQINVRPEVQNGFFNNSSSVVGNTPLTVFSPGDNVNGCLLLQATGQYIEAANIFGGFITKGSAPANFFDGAVVAPFKVAAAGANFSGSISMDTPQYIEPGMGLYYIANLTTTEMQTHRACRYKLF